MDRKKVVLGIALALISAFAAIAPRQTFAQTTTVGNTGLKANGVNSIITIPGQFGTQKCFSVKLSTTNPVLIVSSNSNRGAMFLVNSSSQNMSGASPYQRPPLIYITTNLTTNLGINPSQSNLLLLNGSPIGPCAYMQSTANGVNGNCSYSANVGGDLVFKGAVYGIAESSSTALYDVLPYVQGCEITP